MNKASGSDGIPVELLQILKMTLLKCCTQYARKVRKNSSDHRTGKGQFSFQSQRKAMPKNVQTTAQLHPAHTLAVILKILQARLQKYMDCKLPDVQAEFRKGRGTRDQIANIHWIIKKAGEFQKKTSSFALLTIPKSLTVFISVQLLSHVRCFATPWAAAHQASLSITNSQSLFKIMSTESVMPYNHLILCRPLLLLPSIFPSIRIFSKESALHIRWPKFWSLSFSTSPSSEHPGLISFRMDWLDLLTVQGTLKSLQHHSSKTSILQHSSLFIVQLSHLYMTTGKTIALT